MDELSKVQPKRFKPHAFNKERAMIAKKMLVLPKKASKEDVAYAMSDLICNMGHQVDILGFDICSVLIIGLRAWHADRYGPNPGFEEADVIISIDVG